MADTGSVLTGGANSFQTTAEHINNPQTDLISNGVVGVITNTSGVAPMTGALAVNAQGSPNMTVAVTAGVVYTLATPTSQASQRLRGSIAAQNVTISANSTGGTRYDWIYATVSASGAAAPAADGTGVFTISQSRSTSATTDNGTPPTYGTLLAIVTVVNGAASIANAAIADKRVRAGHTGGLVDTSGNEVVKISATASAVNEVTVANAATATGPQIQATGDDTNIDLRLVPKGTGSIKSGATGGRIDWWEELGRATLSGSADIATVNITAKKFLKIYFNMVPSGTVNTEIRFNNDSGSNYAFNFSTSLGAVSASTSQTSMPTETSTTTTQTFGVYDVINVSAQEKLIFGTTISQSTAGAGAAPPSGTLIGKWANTSAQITRVDLVQTSTGDFASGTELIVLGHD